VIDDEAGHAANMARIRSERAAAGQSPFIESPVVYLLLSACLDAAAQRQNPETN
jgi:hypothetical protein